MKHYEASFFGPTPVLEHQNKRKIVTKSISYKRYGKILFQKVAQGYELPFVQDGSFKNALKHCFLHKYIKHPKGRRHEASAREIYFMCPYGAFICFGLKSDSLDTTFVSEMYKIVT